MTEPFKKGHYYLLKDGRAFYVKSVCHCKQCQKRGYYSSRIVWLDGGGMGWDEDFVEEVFGKKLLNEIVKDSETREPWVDEYILNTIELLVTMLKDDIEELLKGE